MFQQATRLLAIGRGPIRERLRYAFVYHLSGLATDVDLLPRNLRGDFSALFEEVSSGNPANNQAGVEASINRLSEERATQIADKIFDIFVELDKRHRYSLT